MARGDADDRVAAALDRQYLSKHRRIAAEAALPERVAQDHELQTLALAFVVGEEASDGR